MVNGQDAWREALEASEEFRAQLVALGITLPSLGIDIRGVMAGIPLIHLGSADAATVRRLTRALQR
ncbi:hypothetical protein [Kitasatospora sp. NPDC001175]|uniref:hypothetical protein n=1 Tax=Kitasatospora sp. NPDC001175 TaxID=3157103 RepID=UPI003CFC0739